MGSQSFILVKPDALERGLVGRVVTRLEQSRLRVVELKTVEVTREQLDRHYAEYVGEDFYPRLCEYLVGRKAVVGVVEGKDAPEVTKKLVGETEPTTADPGTIRGSLNADSIETADSEARVVRNLVHASEPEDVDREMAVWFPERDYGKKS